ncbi:unnamed protein product [Darwinula stevensoni]|uniref:Uncharacterized protein n=1 Tax=Darwinula stevensoni TaxID=69355 RepID=A0A7R9A811_9CRUS|nr:unnamed protein product [Darwinula stevensoni]CAG0895969.1 unnamed protein product [Darwinula stevensoni]
MAGERSVGRRCCFLLLGSLSVFVILLMSSSLPRPDLSRLYQRVPGSQLRQESSELPPPIHAAEDRHEGSSSVWEEPGCHLPKLDPWDPSILPYLPRFPDFRCDGMGEPLFKKYGPDQLSFQGKEEQGRSIDCCYTPFWRELPSPSTWIEFSVRYEEECVALPLDTVVEIPHDFVRVVCGVKNKPKDHPLYEEFFAFVPRSIANGQGRQVAQIRSRKERVVTRPTAGQNNDQPREEEEEQSREEEEEHSREEEEEQPREEEEEEPNTSSTNWLSVLILGLDAISRNNAIRHLPKTRRVLQEMGAVDFPMYHKVGDNTFPNLIPFLTGSYPETLPEDCYNVTGDGYFDSCPLIWKEFQNQSFVTAFVEDSISIGTFNYMKKGFYNQPTDIYGSPYFYEAEKNTGKQLGYGLQNVKECLGPRLQAQVLLDYAFDVAEVLAKDAYFAFFWSNSLTHDFVEAPALIDDPLYKFLTEGNKKNLFNNTVLIFMSDHGIRWGDLRNTDVGKLEDRLPFAFVYVPPWFRHRYRKEWNALQGNTQVLVTPFDLHATMHALTNFPLGLRQPYNETRNGKNLFLPISKTRTCEDAGISPHWCSCWSSVPVNLTMDFVQEIGRVLIYHVNSIVENHRQCAKLRLASVDRASMHVNNLMEYSSPEESSKELTVAFKTLPGPGHFEATVKQQPSKNNIYEVLDINRINLYGSQSYCVQDTRLKLFCYCREL